MTEILNTGPVRFGSYGQLDIHYDPAFQALWCYMRPSGRPCFTPDLLRDLRATHDALMHDDDQLTSGRQLMQDIRFQVLGSSVPGVFSLGGDLDLFRHLIKTRDRDGLLAYGTACIDMVYKHAISYHRPITTISLVQGDAIGGGFEAALASNLIIAERATQMGCPEVLFNLFPGMGAFSLLARRVSLAQAERIVMSGRLYTAAELYEMGVVDILADDGKGAQVAEAYIRRQQRLTKAHEAIHKVRQRISPLDYQELLDVVTIWVDAALDLDQHDLKIMERLVSAQDRRGDEQPQAVSGSQLHIV